MLGEKWSFVLLKNLLVQKGQENLEAEGMETSFSYQGKWDFPWNHKDEACSLAAKSVFLFESNAQRWPAALILESWQAVSDMSLPEHLHVKLLLCKSFFIKTRESGNMDMDTSVLARSTGQV